MRLSLSMTAIRRLQVGALSLALATVLFAALPLRQAGKVQQPIQAWEKSLAPGLVYRMEYDPNTPRTLNAVRLNPKSPGLQWSTELAGKTINEEGTMKGRLTPTKMAAQSGALVAVNGDFFSYDQGAPIGQLVRSGELVTTAAKARAVFAWGPDDLGIGMAASKVTMALDRGDDVELESVNQPVGANAFALYTPTAGTVQTSRENVSVVLKMPNVLFSPSADLVASFVSSSNDMTKAQVAPGTALLVATGSNMRRLSTLRQGDKVTIHVKTAGFDWAKFDNEIGGGPMLVQGGKVAVDAQEEGFKADFLVRHPRTAIGRTADNDVWIATVDGRQGCSRGATLDEMAGIMVRLGCVDAINLDGGGSTALNLLGLTVGRPSDGVEREVASGILVFGPKPATVSGAIQLNVSGPVSAGGTAQASITLNGKPVDNSDVLWSSRGAAWIDQGGFIHGLVAGKAKILARVFGQPVELGIVVTGPPIADPKKVPAADQMGT